MAKEESKKTKHARSGHKTHRKVFDVVAPGKAPASPNSRSVIPADKPPVPDDQFVPGVPRLHTRASDPSEEHSLMDAAHKKAVIPVASADEAAPPQAVPETPPEGKAPSAPALPKKEPEPEAQAPAEPITQKAEPKSASEVPAAETTQAGKNIPSQEHHEETTPEHLAMEQVVQTDAEPEPEPSESTHEAQPDPADKGVPIQAEQHSSKTIAELLAETGAPTLESEQPPPGGLVISHHHTHRAWLAPVLIVVSILLLSALALNFLLDAEIIQTTLDLPYTDFL